MKPALSAGVAGNEFPAEGNGFMRRYRKVIDERLRLLRNGMQETKQTGTSSKYGRTHLIYRFLSS
jgi:hypothetical protein